MQRPLDAFGIARDDSEVSSSRLIRLRAALFPIPQSAKGDVVARGKIFLLQLELRRKIKSACPCARSNRAA